MFAYRSMFIGQIRSRVVFGMLLLLVTVLNNAFAKEPLAISIAEKRMMPKLFVADAVIEAVHQATLSAETTGRIKTDLF